MSERPDGVVAVTLLYAGLSLLSFLFVVLLAIAQVSLSAGAFIIGGGLEQLGPLAFLLQGSIAAVLSIGLWQGWRWSRVTAILFAAAGILLDVPSISSAVVDGRVAGMVRGAIETVVRVVVIYYLSQEPVTDWFRSRRQDHLSG
jgi:hypothetical protein